MIKASAKGKDGRLLLVLGLSYANLDKFRAEPGDTYIKVMGKELGIPVDVVIFSGETEAHCAETVQHLIGPDTHITMSERLKS